MRLLLFKKKSLKKLKDCTKLTLYPIWKVKAQSFQKKLKELLEKSLEKGTKKQTTTSEQCATPTPETCLQTAATTVPSYMVQLQHFLAILRALHPTTGFLMLVVATASGGGGGGGFFGFWRQWSNSTKCIFGLLCH